MLRISEEVMTDICLYMLFIVAFVFPRPTPQTLSCVLEH